jgi:hypothetical protein
MFFALRRDISIVKYTFIQRLRGFWGLAKIKFGGWHTHACAGIFLKFGHRGEYGKVQYTVYGVYYIRYFWQGNHQIYCHLRCIQTGLANPKYVCVLTGSRAAACLM